jgi:hypothetical protein
LKRGTVMDEFRQKHRALRAGRKCSGVPSRRRKSEVRRTSAAAPEVANLAAKLFAINPKLTVAEVVKLIKDGADTSAADKRLKLINPRDAR